MNFECPICEDAYSNQKKPRSIPCGHTLCDECINSIIRNKNIECPICRLVFQNISVANLPIIYQLINNQPKKPQIASPPIKINDISDQITYLNYAKAQIQQKSQEMQVNINQIKQEINKNVTNIVNELNKSLTNIFQSFDKVLEKQQKCTNDIIAEVDKQITIKQNLLNRSNQIQLQNNEIKNDYPVFRPNFERYVLGVVEPKPEGDMLEKIIGKLNCNVQNFEISNDEKFLKFKESNKNAMQLGNPASVPMMNSASMASNVINPQAFNKGNDPRIGPGNVMNPNIGMPGMGLGYNVPANYGGIGNNVYMNSGYGGNYNFAYPNSMINNNNKPENYVINDMRMPPLANDTRAPPLGNNIMPPVVNNMMQPSPLKVIDSGISIDQIRRPVISIIYN